MFSVLVRCSPPEEDFLTALLWESGTAGLVEEAGGLRAFFEDETTLETLRCELGSALISVRQEVPRDWEGRTRSAFPAVCVGSRFFLVPPWAEDPTPEGRIRLVINPGMACGTGYHPCTQMCLEALERYIRPGVSVLDVGSGSGILSEAAALLGAGPVVGCDVDADAVQVARERIGTPVYVGSADAIRSASMDVIVANISASAVQDLEEELKRVRKPSSVLILSGFHSQETPLPRKPPERLDREGWSCWIVW